MTTQRIRLTQETWNDAGLLREYISAEFSAYFSYGISAERFARMLRLARRLAALAQLTLDEVMAELRTDHAALEFAA